MSFAGRSSAFTLVATALIIAAPRAQQPGTFDDLASCSNYGYPGVDVFAPGGDFAAGNVLADLVIGDSVADADIHVAPPETPS